MRRRVSWVSRQDLAEEGVGGKVGVLGQLVLTPRTNPWQVPDHRDQHLLSTLMLKLVQPSARRRAAAAVAAARFGSPDAEARREALDADPVTCDDVEISSGASWVQVDESLDPDVDRVVEETLEQLPQRCRRPCVLALSCRWRRPHCLSLELLL